MVLVKLGPGKWERYGLKCWIEAAKKPLHHNVLAIALANKLARIAWAVLNKGRAFVCIKTDAMASRPASSRRARAVKAWPGSMDARGKLRATASLDRPCARRRAMAGRDEGTVVGTNKGTAQGEELLMT